MIQDTENEFSKFLWAIQRGGKVRAAEFKLKQGEQTTVRFVGNETTLWRVVLHTRFINANRDSIYTIPCFHFYNREKCPLCGYKTEDPERHTREHFCFLVWDYTDSQLKVIISNGSKASPSEPIANTVEILKDRGRLNGRDIVISKNKPASNFELRTTLTPLDKEELKPHIKAEIESLLGGKIGISDEQDRKLIKPYMRKAVAELWCPELMTDKSDIELKPEVFKDYSNPENEKDKAPQLSAAERFAAIEKEAEISSASEKDYGTIDIKLNEDDILPE